MQAFMKIIVISIIANMYFKASVFACSVFCIDKKGDLVIGHSYDWSFNKGYFMVNKRGHEKKLSIIGVKIRLILRAGHQSKEVLLRISMKGILLMEE